MDEKYLLILSDQPIFNFSHPGDQNSWQNSAWTIKYFLLFIEYSIPFGSFGSLRSSLSAYLTFVFSQKFELLYYFSAEFIILSSTVELITEVVNDGISGISLFIFNFVGVLCTKLFDINLSTSWSNVEFNNDDENEGISGMNVVVGSLKLLCFKSIK